MYQEESVLSIKDTYFSRYSANKVKSPVLGTTVRYYFLPLSVIFSPKEYSLSLAKNQSVNRSAILDFDIGSFWQYWWETYLNKLNSEVDSVILCHA